MAELATSDAKRAIKVPPAVARITPFILARLLPVAALLAFDAAGESKAWMSAFLVVVVVVRLYSLVIDRLAAVPADALTAHREPVVVAAAV